MRRWMTLMTMGLFSTAFCGETLLNADMEKTNILPVQARGLRFSESRVGLSVAPAGTFQAKQIAGHARSGEGALRLDVTDSAVFSEVNVFEYALRITPKTEYEFSVAYFVESCDPDTLVKSRITVFDVDKKPLKYEWDAGYPHHGSWRELRRKFIAPEGAASVGITIQINGKHRAYLDDLVLKATDAEPAAEKTPASPSAVLLDSNLNLELWGDILDRRQGRAGAPGVNRTPGKIRISAARGERESFQLTIVAAKKFEAVSPVFSALNGPDGERLPPECFSARQIDFITLENPGDASLRGWVADPLADVTTQSASPDANALFAISVDVPRDARHGVYTGKVVLADENGTQLASAPIEVRVRNFTLPEQPALKTLFYARAYSAKKQYCDSRPIPEIAADLGSILKEHRINGNQAELPPVPQWKLEDGALIVTDWSAFDRFIENCAKEYNQRIFMMPKVFMLGDSTGGWFPHIRGEYAFGASALSETGIRRMAQFAKQFTAHVKGRFPEYEFFCYLYDEPHHPVWAKLNKIAGALKNAAPDLKIFYVTVFPDALDPLDIWCNGFSPKFCTPRNIRQALERGRRIWYYNYPVSLERGRYIRNRLFPWQVYANQGEGALLWQINNVPPGIDPRTQLDRTYNCGQATLIYPALMPGGKFHSSQRFELIREGIDDFDYLKLLETAVDRRFPGRGRDRVMELIGEMLYELPFEYRNDPDLLRRLRDKIGDEIEQYAAGSATLVTSIPADNARTMLSEVEFTIHAPDGTRVFIDGAEHGTVGTQPLSFRLPLRKMGVNQFKFELRSGDGVEYFERKYELEPDPVLKRLEALCKELKGNGISSAEPNAFLKRAAVRYDAAARSEAIDVERRWHRKLLAGKLTGLPAGELVVSRAKWAFDRGLLDRTEYYLQLHKKYMKAVRENSSDLKIEPIMFGEFFGFRLTNGKIETVVLENGGRIISLKADGVEYFDRGELQSELPPEVRAVMPEQFDGNTPASKLGGYGDAFDYFPEEAYDWDFCAIRRESGQIELVTACRFGKGAFRLERTLTLAAGTGELVLNYRIVNLLPSDFTSDDPKAYHLAWRGRLFAAIGGDPENDRVAPGSEEIVFSRTKPRFFECNFKLSSGNTLSAFDPALNCGVKLSGEKELGYGYVWFNSDPANCGGMLRYTLELVRHTYGNNGTLRNAPFDIPPGTAAVFQCRVSVENANGR